MERLELVYLNQEYIIDLNVSMDEVIAIVESGLAEQGKGRVENPPKPGIHASSNSFIHAMPAYYKDLNIGGLKWVSGYPDNRSKGLPSIMALVILNDMATGAPLCIMDGTWITAVRTAAVSAITVKYCARKNSKVLGIVGTGVQARYNLSAFKIVCPCITTVKITDINYNCTEKFKTDFANKFDVEIIVCDEVKEVAKGSDIILTATQRLEKPIIRDEWFHSGCLGIGLEASRAWDGDAILTADKFITDDWDQTRAFHDHGAFPDGLPGRYVELAEIVNKTEKGRDNEEQRILAINIGLALEDIILADYLYRMAKDRKDYPTISIM